MSSDPLTATALHIGHVSLVRARCSRYVTRVQTSSVVTKIRYSAVRAKKRWFYQRWALRMSKCIDESSLTLGWKKTLMEFDQHSLITTETLVTCVVGLMTMSITKNFIKAAMKIK
jgi:hypothetical protein